MTRPTSGASGPGWRCRCWRCSPPGGGCVGAGLRPTSYSAPARGSLGRRKACRALTDSEEVFTDDCTSIVMFLAAPGVQEAGSALAGHRPRKARGNGDEVAATLAGGPWASPAPRPARRSRPTRAHSGRTAGTPGRRGDRVRRFTRAGVAAALAILSRHSGPLSRRGPCAGGGRDRQLPRPRLRPRRPGRAHRGGRGRARRQRAPGARGGPGGVGLRPLERIARRCAGPHAAHARHGHPHGRERPAGSPPERLRRDQVPEPDPRPLRRQRGPGPRRVQRRPHEGRPVSRHPALPRDARST